MAKFVLAHAKDHYEDGWDVIVECYTIDEVVELAGSCGSDWTTFQEALATVADFVEVYNDRKADIQAEAW